MLSSFEEQILERKDLFYKRLTCNTEKTGNLQKKRAKISEKSVLSIWTENVSSSIKDGDF